MTWASEGGGYPLLLAPRPPPPHTPKRKKAEEVEEEKEGRGAGEKGGGREGVGAYRYGSLRGTDACPPTLGGGVALPRRPPAAPAAFIRPTGGGSGVTPASPRAPGKRGKRSRRLSECLPLGVVWWGGEGWQGGREQLSGHAAPHFALPRR